MTHNNSTNSTVAMAIDAVVAISTTMLASVFLLAVVLPPVASVLIG